MEIKSTKGKKNANRVCTTSCPEEILEDQDVVG